jgi:hypothetical protein
MNKLKNAFQHSQKAVEDKRPHQFMNRLSLTASSSPFDVSPEPNEPPSVALSDLSESERSAYESWWKDLDPFGLNKINNQIMLKFLNGCTLEDSKLEQVRRHKKHLVFALLKKKMDRYWVYLKQLEMDSISFNSLPC